MKVVKVVGYNVWRVDTDNFLLQINHVQTGYRYLITWRNPHSLVLENNFFHAGSPRAAMRRLIEHVKEKHSDYLTTNDLLELPLMEDMLQQIPERA